MSDLRQDIVASDLETFSRELEAKVLDGWRICPTNPGTVIGLYGGNFTIAIVRDAQSLSRVQHKLEIVKDRPKSGGAASLQKARAAKAAKAIQKAQTGKEGDA